MQVERDGFDDGVALGIPGAQTLLQGHKQMHAIRHDDHQHDGRRRRDGRGEGQADPCAEPQGRENGKDDDQSGRRHPRPAAGQDAEDQGHEQKACGQEDHLALDRGFDEGLVDHDRADDAQVCAGEPLFGLQGRRPREFGDFGHGLQKVVFGQLDRDVYNADIAVQGQNAARDARIGQGDVADLRARFGFGYLLRIDEIAHI